MNVRERKVISELIDLYCNSPCLWDISAESFKDTQQKNEAWDELVSKYQEFFPNANLVTVKKKIDCLRTCYRRECRKVAESKRDGSSVSNIHKPTLWYFQLMRFLDKNDDLQIKQDSDFDKQFEPTRRKKKKHRESKKGFKFDQDGKSYDLYRNPFGAYVSQQLDYMSTFQRQVAEKIISETIFLGKMEHLNFDSRIETPSRYRASPHPRYTFSRRQPPRYHHSSPSRYLPSPRSTDQEDNDSSEVPTSPVQAKLPADTAKPARVEPSRSMLKDIVTENANEEDVVAVKVEAGDGPDHLKSICLTETESESEAVYSRKRSRYPQAKAKTKRTCTEASTEASSDDGNVRNKRRRKKNSSKYIKPISMVYQRDKGCTIVFKRKSKSNKKTCPK